MSPARRIRRLGRVPAARRDDGFSLMEVLIALAVLVGGMVSVLALFTHAVAVHRYAVDDARAAMLAEEAIERVRLTWVETGDPAEAQALEFGTAEGGAYDVSVSASPYGVERALAVTVTVAWRRGSTERSATFRTVVTRDAFASRVRELRGETTEKKPERRNP